MAGTDRGDARTGLVSIALADLVLVVGALPIVFGADDAFDLASLAARAAAAVAVLALQWLFLRPVLPASRGAKARSLVPSIVVAGLATTFLAGAAFFVLASIPRLLDMPRPKGADEDASIWVLVGAIGVSWAVFSVLIARWTRRRSCDAEDAIGRVATQLFRGTAVEALALIPVDVMIRRKTDCYCGEPSFFALLLWLAGGILVAGPALFLVWIGRRRRVRLPLAAALAKSTSGRGAAPPAA